MIGLGLALALRTSLAATVARYAAGDTLPAGGSMTRSTVGLYTDVNGVVQTAAINALRDGHYIGGVRHTLLEATATNIAVAGTERDLTNAAWTKTTMTAAKDQAGADGVALAASSLLATGANATALQVVTLASSLRTQSAYVKRLVGTGTVQMTTDGGTSWTTITLTASYQRFSLAQAAVTNPSFGFRIVTSGDQIAVDWVQNEAGQSATSPTSGTRGGDLFALPFFGIPRAMTMYLKYTDLGNPGLALSGVALVSSAGNAGSRFGMYQQNGTINGFYTNGGVGPASANTNATVAGDVVEARSIIADVGAVSSGVARNGGSETVSGQAATVGFDTAFSGPLLWLNSTGSGNPGLMGVQKIVVAAGVRSLAEMRTL